MRYIYVIDALYIYMCVDVRARAVPGGGPLPVPGSKFGCPAVPARAIARARLVEVLAQPDWRVAIVSEAAYGRYDLGDIAGIAAFVNLFPRELVTVSASRMLNYALMLGISGQLAEAHAATCWPTSPVRPAALLRVLPRRPGMV